MRHRTDTINTLPSQELTIRLSCSDGSTQFVGQINGHDCVLAPTREAAVQALLRRAAEGAVH